jgi:DNA-binding IclR family transcriptional regulator
VQLAGNASKPGATVTSRLLAMIGGLDERHRNLALSDLARRAGLALPTAHRPAGELVYGGALQRNNDGRYMVGRLLWEAGLPPAEGAQRQVAEPFLHDVYAATLVTVHLAVRDGDQVLYPERMMGRASVPIVSSVGSRPPMHCTGVAKVMPAHAPRDVQAGVFANLTRVTPYTIVQRSVLSSQLDRIRRGGVASTTEEMSLGAGRRSFVSRSSG